MLKDRLLTAAMALPLLVAALVYLPRLFVCLIFLVAAGMSTYELARMLYPAFCRKIYGSENAAPDPDVRTWPLICALSTLLMFAVAVFVNISGSERGGIIFVYCLVILMGTFSGKDINHSMIRMVVVLFSLSYACLPWLSILDLYTKGSGARYIFLLMGIVMSGDSAAYFVGRKFGRHRLAPRLSPKKTWEGVVGGVFASMVAAQLVNAFFLFQMGPWWLMALIGATASIAGVMGDLVESALKRFSEVKDSGGIFPGHGGILDRVDSFLLSGPFVWIFLYAYEVYAVKGVAS
ncbi:MAG: phosphatidate cytidylyltransferase [Zetaproteobacteria bacterium]|nr:phosphatidate cytidylyltransferase [Zetaproteobacteria bacterium]